MTSVLPQDEAERRQIRTGLARNALVEAGAGTGKTTVVVERIVELLRTGIVTVEQLAVITFTEKAAAELSVRVRQGLERALAAAEDGVERERLRAAGRSLHRARIETLHAFAGGLLRERPVEAGLDPLFEVVDVLGAALDFDEAYERWLNDLLALERAEIARALEVGLGLDHLRALAETLHAHRDVLPLDPAWLRVDAPDLDEHRRELRAALVEIEAIAVEFDVPVETDPGAAGLSTVAEELRRRLNAPGNDLPGILPTACWLPKGGAQRHWADPEGCKRLKAVYKELKTASTAMADALRTWALNGVLPHVQAFVVEYAEQRRRDGRLDFDDLLLRARDMVLGHDEVLRDFRDRFRAVLVDEFQDTDPVQADLVLALAGGSHDTAPEPGRLVVVGDPKQSIYRFRRADISIYDRIKRGPLRDDTLTIAQNFRSVDGILAWSNAVFDALLVEAPGKQAANVPLIGSGLSTGEDRPVMVVRGGAEETGTPWREREARALAATLLRARSEGWPVRDRATGALRPCTWRDMAILVPARTGVDIYERVFADAGVPLRHEGGKTFFRRQEVRELVSLLHAVDDPSDRVAIVATLRSPVFGCSDDDLVLWVSAGGRWTYLAPLDDRPEGRIRDGLELLRRLRRARSGLSLPELVRRALNDTGAVEHALTLPDGKQVAANLLKLVDQARDFSASGGGGLRAFTRWLARNRDEDSEETDAGVTEERDDVVRLMTIHAAKGLEWPIVALANLATPSRSRVQAIPDAAAHRLHLKVGVASRDSAYATPDFPAHQEREKTFEDAERLRLLYVAVTRARDRLVIPVVDPEPKGLLARLLPWLPEVGDDAGAARLSCQVVTTDDLGDLPSEGAESVAPEDAGEVDVAATRALIDTARAAREAVVAVAAVELPVTAATSLEKPWRPVVVASQSAEDTLILGEGPPLAIGDALHRTMQLVSFPGGEDLASVARAICAEAELDAHTDEVVEMARRCFASDAVTRAARADRVLRELAFTVPLPDGAPGFATGRVDLLYREGDAWTVVDYKTDMVANGDALVAAAAHHHAQVGAYVDAVRRLVGVEPRVVLVFARVGGEVELGSADVAGSDQAGR